MSTLLDEPATRPTNNPARRLRATMAAVRVSFTWLGTRKTLTPEQKNQAADTFGAEGQFLSAGKKLLDTRHPAFKAVSAVRGRVLSYWKGISLPYPEPGIRLFRQDDIGGFNMQMTTLKAELEEAVWQLNEHYAELKAAARVRLGRLFNPADYPESLDGLFAVEWDFPSVEPPDYLRQLSPELYRPGEPARVGPVRRGDSAGRGGVHRRIGQAGVASHRTALRPGRWQAENFPGLRHREPERLFPAVPALNVGSSEQLDQLVGQVQQIVRGRRARRSCATSSRSGSRWPPSCRASNRCSTA